jgi:hypothetical protein
MLSLSSRPSKYTLVLQTVFLVNENVHWLEEFIRYHLAIGVDHFFLYDNNGSTGGDGNQETNKYGFPSPTTTTPENQLKFDTLIKHYADFVTVVPWQPQNAKGQIIYGQIEAIKHYYSEFGHLADWTVFTDLDEFLYSPAGLNMHAYLESIPSGVSCIWLLQKKFVDRFLVSGSLVTQDFRCINKEIGPNWAPKNIVRRGTYTTAPNIHLIKTTGSRLIESNKKMRFNHYNTNPKLLKWMRGFYNSESDFSLDDTDMGMLQFKHLL